MKKIVFSILFICSCVFAKAAIGFVSAVTTQSTGVGALRITKTVSAGANRILYCGITLQQGSLSSVTYTIATTGTTTVTGNATLVASGSNGVRVHIYYIALGTNTVTGSTATVVANFGNSDASMGLGEFTGVHQTTPFGTSKVVTGSSNNISNTYASSTGNLAVDVTGVVASSISSDGAGQTVHWNTTGATFTNRSTYKAGAASVTMSHTQSGGGTDNWVTIGTTMVDITVGLPVELVSFNAEKLGNENLINWKSSVEVNFKNYDLESSDNGLSFKKIASILPIGNQTSINNYQYIDYNRFTPITYYRLKMIDLDNTFKYSKIVYVEHSKNTTSQVIVFPNPANNELYISLIAPNHKEGTIEIRDLLGRSIYQQKVNLHEGVENSYINATDFKSGTYIVNVTYDDQKSENIKVIINNRN